MVNIIKELVTQFIDNKNIEQIFFDKINEKLTIIFQLKDYSKIDGIPSEYKGYNIVITDKIDPIFEHDEENN